jgi:fatty acid desaturase
VHHLFPGVCHCHYPQLAPIVLRTSAEFGLLYKVYPTFTSALAAHFRQLRNVGWGKHGVPSLATVG